MKLLAQNEKKINKSKRFLTNNSNNIPYDDTLDSNDDDISQKIKGIIIFIRQL